MNLFENYKGIYIEPDALEVAMENNQALTIDGAELNDLKVTAGKPESNQNYTHIQQDGIDVYVTKKLDRQSYNINIVRKKWWQPGKLEAITDQEKFPHPRL